jgi:hypothetical protein
VSCWESWNQMRTVRQVDSELLATSGIRSFGEGVRLAVNAALCVATGSGSQPRAKHGACNRSTWSYPARSEGLEPPTF